MEWRASSFRAICDRIRSKVRVAKTSSFRVVGDQSKSELVKQTVAKHCDRLGARAKQGLRDFERSMPCETFVRPLDAIKKHALFA